MEDIKNLKESPEVRYYINNGIGHIILVLLFVLIWYLVNFISSGNGKLEPPSIAMIAVSIIGIGFGIYYFILALIIYKTSLDKIYYVVLNKIYTRNKKKAGFEFDMKVNGVRGKYYTLAVFNFGNNGANVESFMNKRCACVYNEKLKSLIIVKVLD